MLKGNFFSFTLPLFLPTEDKFSVFFLSSLFEHTSWMDHNTTFASANFSITLLSFSSCSLFNQFLISLFQYQFIEELWNYLVTMKTTLYKLWNVYKNLCCDGSGVKTLSNVKQCSWPKNKTRATWVDIFTAHSQIFVGLRTLSLSRMQRY